MKKGLTRFDPQGLKESGKEAMWITSYDYRRGHWKSHVAELVECETHSSIDFDGLTLGEGFGNLYNLNQTRIPRVWGCSYRVCLLRR
jgi:hypothetical protein